MIWFVLYLIPGVLLCIADVVTDVEDTNEAVEKNGRDLAVIMLFFIMCLVTLFHPIWFLFRIANMVSEFRKAKEQMERWKRRNGK